MWRRLAFVLTFGLLAVACGDDATTPAVMADRGIDGSSELCAAASIAEPEILPVGQVIELDDDGSDHVVCPSYDRAPPASGAHFPAWQNCGFYTEPIQAQTAVHSLEHGAVWIAYQPDLDPEVLATIRERMGVERHLLAAPYPGLKNPIVLTAWTRQLAVDDWSDPAVEKFLLDFTGEHSGVAPEAGVSCEGAIGSAPDDPDANYDQVLEEVG